jgi:hypothetical protein
MVVVAGAMNLSEDARRELGADLDRLRAVYGERWPRIPTGFGERAASVRAMWTSGLVPVAVDDADPVRVTHELRAFVDATATMIDAVVNDMTLLGEPFRADLTALPLERVRQLCKAIVRLAAAPQPTQSWAAPAGAEAADLVLATIGDDLRSLAAIRRELYDEFTDDVWLVTGRGARARRQLAPATRSGHAPVSAKRALTLIRRGRELNGAIAGAWTAVSGRLGHFATAGIPDVDGAVASLQSVRAIHTALGAALDVDALRALIVADAFVADELLAPARAIATCIDSWEPRARSVGAVAPMTHTLAALRTWTVDTDDALTVLSTLKEATAPLRSSIRTVGQILDDAVRRDLVRLLTDAEDA